MAFRYLEPMYGFSAEQTHVAVSDGAQKKLLQMADALLGTDDLIAIYIPEGTEEVYQVGNMRGRVVGAVRLIDMPPGNEIEDYYFEDWDGTRRWPVGWPCTVVYAPPVQDCPTLRTLVDQYHGRNSFQPYVARLQYGPVELDPPVAKALEAWFDRLN